jgi:hypothetical protein
MKNLIKSNTILLLSLCFYGGIIAQSDRSIEERIEVQRIAFITQRVNLTPQEAQVFWPIYNEYREKEKQIKNDRSDRLEIIDMDEADAEIYVNKILALEQQELDLKKQYIEKLKSVISAKKILRFYAAERMFKERLLQAMNQRKNNVRN